MSCIDSASRWSRIQHTALAVGLCILGLPVSEPAHSGDSQVGVCPVPGLARYSSRSFATEQGVRRRCALLQNIERDGTPLPSNLRGKILHELTNRYAVEINFIGVVGVSHRVVDYLLRYMPETAALVSVYSGKEYAATQVDGAPGPRRFFVTDNDAFAASFTYLRSNTSRDLSEYVFFENGRAEVLLWTVWGNSFIHYDLEPATVESSRYDIRIQVFTESRLLRAILRSGLFRRYARSMFKDILDDVESAVHGFAGDPAPNDALPPYFVTGLRNALHPKPSEFRPPGPSPHDSSSVFGPSPGMERVTPRLSVVDSRPSRTTGRGEDLAFSD